MATMHFIGVFVNKYTIYEKRKAGEYRDEQPHQ